MNSNIDQLLASLSENLSTEELLFAHFSSEIAVAIAAKRIEMGLTQKDFAERLGKTQAVVSKWENGEVNFTLRTLIDLAQKLDLELALSLKPVKKIQDDKIIKFPGRYYTSPSNHYTTCNELMEM